MPKIIKLQLRIPATTHRRLVKQAKRNRRSLNSEIVQRLESQREAEALDGDRAAFMACITAITDEIQESKAQDK